MTAAAFLVAFGATAAALGSPALALAALAAAPLVAFARGARK